METFKLKISRSDFSNLGLDLRGVSPIKVGISSEIGKVEEDYFIVGYGINSDNSEEIELTITKRMPWLK